MRTPFLVVLLALASPALAVGLDDPPAAASPAKKALYDESADAKQQIAEALTRAKAENRRVLIQWGGNWCPWCIRLNEVMTSDKHLRKEILYEYDVVHVDAGKPKGKNLDLAKSFGAEINGFPFLTILSADGKPVANAETEQFEVKGPDGTSSGLAAGHDREKLLKFLTDHQAPQIAAKDVLASGLARAKGDGKTVFVHFGAPWCIWCKRLEAWMARPEIAAVLAKDFVDVKIDTDRMQGGQEMLDSMNPVKQSGIPWIVFLDAEGKPIADANAEGKENVGFPATDAEIAHFESMLNKARRNMTESDVRTLADSLRESAKQLK